MQQFVNLKDVLDEFGEEVVGQAQREVGATRTRFGLHTTWQLRNKKWYPVQSKRRTFKGRIESTGKLRNSIAYEVNGTTLTFSMLHYGEQIDRGRLGIKTRPASASGKGAPFQPKNYLLDYVNNKPIRMRNQDTGRFEPATNKRKQGVAFMINRKIKWFGIEATHFFSEPFNIAFEKLPDDLAIALIEDLELLLIENLENDS